MEALQQGPVEITAEIRLERFYLSLPGFCGFISLILGGKQGNSVRIDSLRLSSRSVYAFQVLGSGALSLAPNMVSILPCEFP